MAFNVICKHFINATVYLEDNGQISVSFDSHNLFHSSTYHSKLVYTGYVLITELSEIYYLCKRNDETPKIIKEKTIQTDIYLVAYPYKYVPYLGLSSYKKYLLRQVPSDAFIKFLQNTHDYARHRGLFNE